MIASSKVEVLRLIFFLNDLKSTLMFLGPCVICNHKSSDPWIKFVLTFWNIMCSISKQSANLYPFDLLFLSIFPFYILPFGLASICTKVYNTDMNDESCELKQKKKSAGMKMDALMGFGGGGSGRRGNYNPEKSIFILWVMICSSLFWTRARSRGFIRWFLSSCCSSSIPQFFS